MVLYHSTTLLYALLLWNHDLFPTVRNVAAKTTTTSEAMRPFRSIDVLNFHRKNHNDIVLEEEEEDSNVNDELTTKDVQEVFFQQTLNHFSKNEEKDETINKVVVDSTETFQQRYFYTNRYASPDDNEQMNSLRGAKEEEEEEENRKTYAFLCCGGEGPSLTKDVLTDSVHCSGDMIYLAQRLFEEENAIVHLFALEHRYYGKSYPEFPDNSSPVSNENLQYLSSRQAIHDVATFIQYANGHYILNDGNPTKWVTFGGSYPGMVSAWSRYKFPNLVHAAVSNSSPVQAQLDFPEYNNHVAKDLGYDVVGGSAECLDIVSRGHEEIGELLSAEGEEKEGGYEKVAELFHVCNGAEPFYKDVKNKNMFLGDGVIYIPAQGNDPSCGSDGSLCNIANVSF
uniref:Uncharacterized protein n=1 Tax=Ditylum brightwellii TaxID=49249 RepID=A0A7S4W557_9STRA